jgi:ketosteroid isomerase-like protein
MFGTGADERRIGPDEMRMQAARDWEQSEASSFTLPWRHIAAAGDVAWVAAAGEAHVRVAGQDMDAPIRTTFVLERRGDGWQIAHMHASVPMAEQAEGQSWPTE